MNARRRFRRTGMLWLCLACLSGLPSLDAAQPQEGPREGVPGLGALTQFRAVIDLYWTGRFDLAVGNLLAGGPEVLRQSVEARHGASGVLLLAARVAAMLHTDAIAVAWPSDRRVARQHLELAGAWARTAGELGDEIYERRWALAAGLLLTELGSTGGGVQTALAHFETACDQFADDVPLHVAAGWLEERTALAPLALSAQSATSDALRTATRGKRRYLDQARAHLERAHRADRSDAEATLRLAHVLLLLDAPGDARRLLEPLAAEPAGQLAPGDAALARLFLGKTLAAMNERDAALALFDQAAALVPLAQSPRFARLAVAPLDAADDGLAFLASVPPGATVAAADPWLDYLVGHLARGPRLRAALRQAVQR